MVGLHQDELLVMLFLASGVEGCSMDTMVGGEQYPIGVPHVLLVNQLRLHTRGTHVKPALY